MKKWSLKVKSNPKEIRENLESSLGSTNRFVLNMNYDNKNLVKFKIRKRVLLAFEINVQNNIIVNGKLLKSPTDKETDVEISFTHHPFSKFITFGNIILGLGFLAALILEASSNSYLFVVGGILIAIGILLGLHLKNNFDRNVQEYKTLISELLEIQNIKV